MHCNYLVYVQRVSLFFSQWLRTCQESILRELSSKLGDFIVSLHFLKRVFITFITLMANWEGTCSHIKICSQTILPTHQLNLHLSEFQHGTEHDLCNGALGNAQH